MATTYSADITGITPYSQSKHYTTDMLDKVKGVGMTRLDAARTAATMPAHVRRIRRASTRARRIGQCVSVLELPVEKRAPFVADVSLLALVSEITAPASHKRLELAASASPKDTGILAAEMTWNALRGNPPKAT